MTQEDTIRQIARDILGLETLEPRKSDSLDFHELSVWSIRDALGAAYEAGFAAARNAVQDAAEEAEEASCGFACPQCGASDQIDILAKVWVRLRPDGSTDPDLDSLEHEWSYESEALCSACGFTATAGAFRQADLKDG